MTVFIKDMVLWFVWVLLRPLIWFIPLKLLYQMASLCAYGFYFFAGEKKMMIEELQKIFKDKSSEEIKQIAMQSFVMYFKRQVENIIYGRLTKGYLEKMVSIEGIENLKNAVGEGKGVIILLSHFGSHLLVLPALAFKGYRINQIAGPPVVERPINQKIFEIRKRDSTRLPITFLSSDQSLRSVFKALKNNELVAIAFDGRVGNKWIPVKMFNMKAMVSPGPVRIAIKTGATIIPTFIIRNSDNTHRLILEPPFELEFYEDEERILSANLQRLAEIFERYIQRFPCHYGMILQIMRERARSGVIDFSLLPENQ